MSIFVRPDSPPPRQPTPDFIPAPLPSPYARHRIRTSSQQQYPGQHLQSLSPAHPPGLSAQSHGKRLLVARSCDHIGVHTRMWPEHADFSSNGSVQRSNSNSKAPNSTKIRALPPRPLPEGSALTVKYEHRRSISSATPKPPPLSPVTPILQSSVLSVLTTDLCADERPLAKSALRLRPVHASSVRFPDLVSLPHKKSDPCFRREQFSPLPEKQRSSGPSYFRFFSLRNRTRTSRLNAA